jgi:hypothetical protein
VAHAFAAIDERGRRERSFAGACLGICRPLELKNPVLGLNRTNGSCDYPAERFR